MGRGEEKWLPPGVSNKTGHSWSVLHLTIFYLCLALFVAVLLVLGWLCLCHVENDDGRRENERPYPSRARNKGPTPHLTLARFERKKGKRGLPPSSKRISSRRGPPSRPPRLSCPASRAKS
ncbi:unnamed protein product [Darwinula stevensoni]|uniref:Uncharacterized protein n=1 Tax=Darwinula stevensoni TaxID=69355 RepID=A0A7R8XDY1_9CRUS|nr:unnamed protein product [Darwinula stevensoni]CAG0889030.1 unnamed protein product [Darwinula stevensoni]